MLRVLLLLYANLFVLFPMFLFYFTPTLPSLDPSAPRLTPCPTFDTADYNYTSVWWCVKRMSNVCVSVCLCIQMCVRRMSMPCVDVAFVCLCDRLKPPRGLQCHRSRPSHLSSVLFSPLLIKRWYRGPQFRGDNEPRSIKREDNKAKCDR